MAPKVRFYSATCSTTMPRPTTSSSPSAYPSTGHAHSSSRTSITSSESARIAELETLLARSEAELQRTNGELNAKNGELAKTRKELAGLQKSRGKQIGGLKNKLNAAARRHRNLDAGLKRSLGLLSDAHKEIRKEKAAHRATLCELEQAEQRLQETVDAAAKRHRNLDAGLRKSMRLLSDTHNNVRKEQAAHQATRLELDAAVERHRNLDAGLKKCMRLLSDAHNDKRKEQAAHWATQRELQQAEQRAIKLQETINEHSRITGVQDAALKECERLWMEQADLRVEAADAAQYWMEEANAHEEMAAEHARQRYLWQQDMQRLVGMAMAEPGQLDEQHCIAWGQDIQRNMAARLAANTRWHPENDLDEYDDTREREWVELEYPESSDREQCWQWVDKLPLRARPEDLQLGPDKLWDTDVRFLDENLKLGDDFEMFGKRKLRLRKSNIELEPLPEQPQPKSHKRSRFASVFEEIYGTHSLSEENVQRLGGRRHWNESSNSGFE